MSTATRVRGTLDMELMRRDIRRKMGGPPKISLRVATQQIAALNGGQALNFNTLGHILRKGIPDMEHYAQICTWLEVPLETYTKRGIPPALEGLELIDAVLMRDPKLTREQAVALSDMLRSAYKTLTRKESDP